MCGARSTLGGKDFWNKLKFSSRLIRDQERLCAVCTIKRLLPHAPGSPISSAHFPSTASIASSSYRDEIKKYWYVEEVQTAFKHLVQTLEALKLELPPPDEPRARLERIEGAYFYNDFYQLDQLKRETGESPTANQLILAKKRLETLNELLKQHKAAFPEPNSYYAVLMIDGDHMGKRLDSIQNRENHQEFSQVLAELAVQANSIVQQLRGRIIYSGGDDVLALFPVDSVLTAANELQSNFNQKLEAAGFSGMHMSAGISVAHNSQPLQLVIAAAREAESEAKSACGRNALVINVAKRSGEPRKAGLKWNSPGGTPAPLDTIRLFVEAIAGDQLSGKLSYELWEELPALADSPDNPSSAWFTKELYRLLKRHRINEEWKSDQELQDWADALSNLWDFMPFPQSSKIEQITQWLLIARFLAKGEQI